MNNIEELINQLKEQGVTAGKNESEIIIAQAEKKAEYILHEAKKKATEIVVKAEKEVKERDIAAKSALEIASKFMVHKTATKIAEILDIALKEEIEKTISNNEAVSKLIKGEKVDIKELIPLMREKISDVGAEIEYIEGSIKIFVRDKNFHYEISPDTIADSFKSYIREELHGILFPVNS